MATDNHNTPAFIAYHYKESGEGKKGFRTRIGAAFAHKNGEGFNLVLDYFPVNGGTISLFKNEPKADDTEGAGE